MKKLTRLFFLVAVLATMGLSAWAQTTELFFSEYAEGSGNNKYIEIYNGTGADVDLTPYVVKLGSNGGDWGNTADLTGTLTDGDVFIIANSSADPTILALADITSNVTYFNGNDALGLFKNDVLIDVIGEQGVDPGSGWEVAGVSNATAEHTLVRKSSVCSPTTDWTASAGTSTADSQWEVYGQNEWGYLGAHVANCGGGANPPTAITGDATNISNGSATLNGTVSANGAVTTITFEYGTDDTYGNTVNADPNTTTGSNTPVSYDLSGLTNGTTYHYRVVAVNSEGTTQGSDKTFVPFADIINEEGFDNDLGSWSQYSVTGDQIWAQDSYGSATYAKMSGYSGGSNENEDWLISPALNFDNYDNEIMWFETAMNYSGPDLMLKISEDYSGSGDPNAATWTDLTASAAWSGGGWAWQHSGVVDLSTFNGTNVYVAFIYTSTVEGSATWEVDGILISGEQQTLPTAARIVGTINGWNTTDPNYVMSLNANGVYELVKTLGAGQHEYKLLEGDDWSQPNYPGTNQVIMVGSNEDITWKGNIDADLVFHGMPAVAGNFFEAMGQGSNWDPSNPAGEMVDPEGDDVYTWTGVVPQGNWEFKVTFNDNWDQSTGGNVGFTSNGVDETTMTYTFATNTTEVTGPPPPTAPVTFIVDDSQNQFFTGFFLKGSWDVNGQYDPAWGGGMEHSMLYDDGTNGDVTPGDNIWTVTLDLIVDGGSNNWSWGVNDADHNWVAGGPDFQVATEDPVTTTLVFPGVPNLLITEIMYNPPESGTDSLEFVEIYNNGTVDVNLNGYKITDGFEVYFPDYTLAAGDYIVTAVDSMAMVNTFGYIGAFEWVSGGLSNGGESITLLNPYNTPVNSVTYDDNSPWPTEPDGSGPSLRFCDYTLDNTQGENWSASVMMAATNGAGDPIYATPGSECIFPITDLVITEVMYDSPEVGLDVLEFIEIQNIGDEAIDLEGVYFSKGIEYTFPSMILEPENYVVVCADAAAFQLNFGIDAIEWTAGWLEDTGEEVELTDPNGFVIDYFEYENESPWPLNAAGLGSSITLCDPLTDNADPANWTASNEFLAVSYFGDTIWATPYGGCVYPIPELVITEIMYNSPESGADSLEFIEIYNASEGVIDLEGIYFSAGLEYTFPALTLQPAEYLLVSVNAQAMQNTFGVTSYEWTNGGLSNGGELIEIRDIHDQVIDYVEYDDVMPWDTLADGFGPSLTFCNPTLDNALAENWMASAAMAAINANNDTIYATPGAGCANLDPIANFEADQTVVDMGDAVNFTDLSTGDPTTWAWTFDGATPASSGDQNPAGVVYPDPGQYDVTLTVTNEYGESTETKAMYITVNDTAAAPVADFTASQTTISVGSSIDFMDMSLNNPTSWEWTFDGATPGTSNSENPTGIQYTSVGTFTVTLVATNEIGSDTETKTDYITVRDTTAFDLVITEIMYNPPESGNDSLEFVEIYNNDAVEVDLEGYYFSQGFEYEFLEGSIAAGEYILVAINADAMMNTFGVDAMQWTSGALSNSGEIIELRNSADKVVDIVEFTDSEPWPVRADGDGPSMTLCNPEDDNNVAENWWASLEFAAVNAENDTIWATPGTGCSVYPSAPTANFEANVTSGSPGLAVEFTDLSSDEPTEWAWTFEGGYPETSAQQNPGVIYLNAGDFDVTLTATNEYGSDTKTETDYIHISVGMSDDLTFAMAVYPNPSNTGIFNIASNNETMKEIKIYNIAGSLVYENAVTAATTKLDLSAQNKGVYFLRLTDVESGNTIIKKLIVK
jgi:PKD repeat protein